MRLSILTCSLILTIYVAGCTSVRKPATASEKQQYTAPYTTEKIQIDGKLNEKAWDRAEALTFEALDGSFCTENGTVKIICDDKYIYVGAKLFDSDIVQESNENWAHHYKTGDVVEFFIKPNGKLDYWEIYSTPNSKKTAFYYHSKGRLGLPSSFSSKMPGLLVASSCSGTLNNPKKSS